MNVQKDKLRGIHNDVQASIRILQSMLPTKYDAQIEVIRQNARRLYWGAEIGFKIVEENEEHF